MRATSLISAVLGGFLVVAAVVYALVTGERAGTVMLGASGPALLLIAAWLAATTRHRPVLPEDEGEPVAGAGQGELGYFPSSSVWPFVLSVGAVVAANGLAFGVWLAVAGGALVLVGVVGYAVEANSKA